MIDELAKADHLPEWMIGLTHKDWMFDGKPIRGDVMIAMFNNLDWSKAWVDMGPSIAGNLGPYWHVPLRETIVNGQIYAEGDTVHRLYPKLLLTKWLGVVRQAVEEERRAAMK